MAIVALQIDSLGDTFFPEYVMAASGPLGEPQIPEQTTQVVECHSAMPRASGSTPSREIFSSRQALGRSHWGG